MPMHHDDDMLDEYDFSQAMLTSLLLPGFMCVVGTLCAGRHEADQEEAI